MAMAIGGSKMKKQSLSVQIWLWFTLIIGCFSLCLSLVFYTALEKFFEEQIYAQIEAQQINEIVTANIIPSEINATVIGKVQGTPKEKLVEIVPAVPLEIKHAYVTPIVESGILIAESLESAVELESSEKIEIIAMGQAQKDDIQRYEKVIDGEKEMSVISKKIVGGQPFYVYSFARENFNQLILSQFWFVFVAILVISALLLIPAKLIAKKISQPLASLENDMHRIADRDWQESIAVEGPREIMNLSDSCERMRKQLVQHDQNQQVLMQSISHELKTPIMVIRNYLQAMKDGYYPKGSLESAIDIMDLEAKRLEKKTKDLICITNIDYMKRQNVPVETIQLPTLILEVYDRLKYKRTDIQWNFTMNEEVVLGHYELWKVVFENLFQNQLRYSKSQIGLVLSKDKEKTTITISNDGPLIEDKQLEKMFVAFSKGEGGQSGLGLSIVKGIIDLYDGELFVKNKDEGVEFLISIPTK